MTTRDAFSDDQIQMPLPKDVPDVNHVAAALKQPVSAEHWARSDRFGSLLFVASRWQVCYAEEHLALSYINHSVIARVMAMHTCVVFIVLANVACCCSVVALWWML